MSKIARRAAALIVAASLLVANCATLQSNGEPLTAEQRIARCAGMVVVGAVVGAIIANNTSSGNAGRGILPGALLGGAACAVWSSFQSQQDRERLAQMQMAAASTGRMQDQQWVTPEGQPRQLTVGASTQTEMNVNAGSAPERRICRTIQTTAATNAGRDSMSEIWCRNTDGTWAAAPSATPVA